MTIATLPTLNVYVAFNTLTGGYTLNTANQVPFSNTSYWTDVTSYVQDFQTIAGKQHFIDRVESTGLTLNFNNRTGYFTGNPYVLNVRMPIGVTATWNGTTYPIFWGFTDTIRENIQDQLNSELTVNATDATKILSLRLMATDDFWDNYVRTTNTSAWYRATTAASATVTGATGVSAGGGYYNITYKAINNFTVGQSVTVSGLSNSSGATGNFNFSCVQITSATPTQFVIQVTFPATTGNSSGTGTAYIANVYNTLTGASNGLYQGNVSFQNNGAMVYAANGCVDLGNGGTNFFTGATTVGGGALNITTLPSGWNGVDFWILGNGISGQTVFTQDVFVSGTPSVYNLKVFVTSTGELSCIVYNGSTPLGTAKVSGKYINDGYWHHIGLVSLSNGYLELYADGAFANGSAGLQSFGLFTFDALSGNFVIGYDGIALQQNCLAALIDELVISTNVNVSQLSNQVLLRYKAGLLLQQGQPATNYSCFSGDRIAEILCISGYGSIQLVSGVPQVVLPTWTNSFGNTVSVLNIATSYKTYIPYVYGNANGSCQVEPYYYDTPVTGTSALGLIQQITETDIGAFYQGPDGAFYFNPQNYYGTWSWNSTTKTGTWTVNPAISPSGYYVWDDNNTGVPYDGPSLQMVRDDVDLWSVVKVSPQSGAEQIYENESIEDQYGYSTLTKSSTVPTSLDAALSTANFLGYLFSAPLPRVQNVELRAETVETNVTTRVPGYYIPALIGTLFGDVVQFIRTPPNASGAGIVNQKMVVEGISHQFHAEPGTWRTSFILDPYPVKS